MAGLDHNPEEPASDSTNGPASQPPAPPAWTAPPRQPPPAWPPPSPWAAPAPFGSSRLANVAAVVLLVLGLIVGALGLVGMVGGLIGAGFASNSSDAGIAGALGFGIGPLAVVFGVLEITSAIGIGIHQPWARWLGIALGLTGVAGSIWLQISYPDVFEFFGLTDAEARTVTITSVALHGFVVLALIAAGGQFRRRLPHGQARAG